MIYITEWLLYICFAFFTGHVVMEWVPADRKPMIRFPVTWLYASLAGIALLSLVPLIDMTFFFAEQLESTFTWTFLQMLQKMEIGKGWLLTIAFVITLLAAVKFKEKLHRYEYLFVTTIMVVALSLAFSWSSHVSYIEQLPGFLAHGLHFLTVMIWMGGLFAVSWASTRGTDWLAFLRWFTPLSITCMALSILAGFIVMNLLISEYVTSWVFPYGQAILWKHLFVILLLAYALINGVLIRRRLARNDDFDPRPWFRLESISALAAFAATTAMGQQEPPHDVRLSLESLQPSSMYLWFSSQEVTPATKLVLQLTPMGIGFGIVALLLLTGLFMSYARKWPVRYALGIGFLFVLMSYLSVMYSL